jgi:very-short-patch-repair endonuclease
MLWTELARAQAGVVTRMQLLLCGLSDDEVRGLIGRAELRRLHPGVYLHSSLAATEHQRRWAATLWSGGVLSHATAGLLLGLPIDPKPVVQVTVAQPWSRRPQRGVLVHRVSLGSREIIDFGGLPVTSRRRTILDLLRTEPRGSAMRLFDRGLQQNWITSSDLSRSISAGPLAGNVQLRQLLSEGEPGAHAESERVLHRLLHRARIVGWTPQLRVPLPGTVAYLDVGFDVEKVGIEVDGRRFHGADSDRFESDRRRQNALIGSGWLILRFTWRRLRDEAAEVEAEIRQALRLRRPIV